MSLFSRALRPPPTMSDDAIERYLADLHAEIQPDPLFRRRLRSDAVNRFVAAREGLDSPVRVAVAARRMGRVGRACLYASFTLGVSAASVLAASQEALPGDALYGLKQRVEQLRIDILPDHLQGEMAAYALGERIEEMSRLAESGRLVLAIAMAPAIEHEFERLSAWDSAGDAGSAERIERHLLVLEGLLDKLPATARAAVESVINGTPGMQQGSDEVRTTPTSGANAAAGAAGADPGPDAAIGPDPTPRPDRTPRPEPTATPEPTGGPDHTPKPAQTHSPEPYTQPLKIQSSD